MPAMFRRKLTAYTLMYTAGIAAGFFIFERSRTIEALGFVLSLFASVILLRDEGMSTANRHKAVMLILFLTGALLFSVRCAELDHDAGYALSDTSSIRGEVLSASVKNGKVRLIIRNEERDPAKVLVAMKDPVAGHEVCLMTGSIIEAPGRFCEISGADDPGLFDYGLYMRGKGVGVSFKADRIDVIDPRDTTRNRAIRYLFLSRENFLARFDKDTGAFIRGAVFGDKTDIDEDMLRMFNDNSTGHILAVSGLHIGFLYGLMSFLTGKQRTKGSSAVITAAMLIYGTLTMWSASTVRACIVMTVKLLSVHLKRPFDMLSSVSFAAFILLTFQPYQLFDSGFQMTFLAMLGMTFLTGPLSSVAGRNLAEMLAVQAGTIPVITATYCRMNPLAIFINIPVIALASLMVPACILLYMAQMVFGMLPGAGVRLAELVAYSIIKLNGLLDMGGGFSVRIAGAGSAAVIAIYALMFGASSEWVRVRLFRGERREIARCAVLLAIPLIMLGSCMYDRFSDDEVVFVAVGQGDCTHVRAAGHDILIDGGGQESFGSKGDATDKEDDGYNVGERILMPYLLHEGAESVDIALVTHLHADHYKGICELSEVYPVGAIGVPYDYRGTELSEDDAGASRCVKEPELLYIKPETRVDISEGVYIEPIWPLETSKEPLDSADPNEHNTVYMIHYGSVRIMVTGDLLEEDELEMVRHYEGTDTLRCDVLKVAHHGSKSSSSEAFLDAAAPRIAVIQCGKNNIYGHPHAQTLERLESRGIPVFRTDESGAVGIDIRRSGKISVDTCRK